VRSFGTSRKPLKRIDWDADLAANLDGPELSIFNETINCLRAYGKGLGSAALVCDQRLHWPRMPKVEKKT
jgi:hypothetical protein